MLDSANEAENGLIEADLGSGVLKQRLAKKGQGKSGSYRVIICFKKGERAIFVYAFEKAARANIKDDELKAFKSLAKILLSLTERELVKAVETGTLFEVKGHGKRLQKQSV